MGGVPVVKPCDQICFLKGPGVQKLKETLGGHFVSHGQVFASRPGEAERLPGAGIQGPSLQA